MAFWAYTIRLGDIWTDERRPFTERRDVIVKRLRDSSWLLDNGPDSSITQLVDDLAEAADAGEFDELWDDVYDLANTDRAWIDTVSKP